LHEEEAKEVWKYNQPTIEGLTESSLPISVTVRKSRIHRNASA